MEEQEKKTQNRKSRAKNGECKSRMMSFRADDETIKILEFVGNKGRLLNRLVQDWATKHKIMMDDPHADPRENDIEEYFT